MSSVPQNPYEATFGNSVAMEEESVRTAFIRQTYMHLAGAILLFMALEFLIFTVVPAETQNAMYRMLFGSQFGWLGVMFGFMAVSWVAERWASSTTSKATQYLGLGVFIVAEAIIFFPLLYVAQFVDGAISSAALITAVVFGGLTVLVFVTRADFSWLGKVLFVCMLGAIALVLCSVFIGFNLGILFIGAMILLASGYILYHTSNVLHHYRTDQYVAAALALFASVALLFWYILQFVMMSRD